MAANEGQEDLVSRTISNVIEQLIRKPIDNQACVKCINELPAIALQLGTECTQHVILPLIQSAQFQDVPIVLRLLDCIDELKNVIGGPSQVYRFLPILEDFYKLDSTEVSNKITACLKLLFKDASAQVLTDHFVPFVKRMTNDHWPLTRTHSCGLFVLCYPRLSKELKHDLLGQYAELCEDGIPCVRIEVARHLGELAKTTDFDGVTEEIVPIFTKLASDEHESVRHLLIDTFFGISFRFIPRNVEQLLMPTMRKFFDDKSYLVRHRVATRFLELQKAVGTGITKSDLLPAITKLLQDPCPEVRVPAISKIIDFWEHSPAASSCEKQLMDDILPALVTQSLHPCQQVRIALCNIVNLSTVLGERVKDHLLPVLITLIQDVNPVVRVTVADHIGQIKDTKVVELITEGFSTILEEQMGMAENAQARVIGLKVVMCLGQNLGQDFFHKTLTATYLMNLVDADTFVRESAFFHINNILKRFGNDWLSENIIPFILQSTLGNSEQLDYLISSCIDRFVDNEQLLPVLTKEWFQLIREVCQRKEGSNSILEQLLQKFALTCDERFKDDVSECLELLKENKPEPVPQINSIPLEDLENKITLTPNDTDVTNTDHDVDTGATTFVESTTVDQPQNPDAQIQVENHHPNCEDNHIIEEATNDQSESTENQSIQIHASEDQSDSTEIQSVQTKATKDDARNYNSDGEFEEIAINSEGLWFNPKDVEK